MHIVLTDVLTCPRCGPEFGLIILADRVEERKVIEGRLGCANCREAYPVVGGVADLRWGGAAAGWDEVAGPFDVPAAEDGEKALRMAALLGLTGPSQPVAVVTRDVELVRGIQGFLPDTGVLGVSPEAAPAGEDAGMGWLLAAGTLPLRSRSLGGVVLAAGASAGLLREALRCLGRGARVVIEPAAPDTADLLLREGGEVLLEQDGVAVASDPSAG